VNVLDPPDGFDVTDLPQVALGGGQIGMSEDHLAHDLDGHARARGVRRRVSPQVMRTDLDSRHPASFHGEHACRGVADGEDPLIRRDALFVDIGLEPVCHFLGDVRHLSSSATLGVAQDEPSILDVLGGELEDFADPHPCSGHEFQDKAVPGLRNPEDDLVDGLFLQCLPRPAGGVLKSLRSMGESQGFLSSGSRLFLMKLNRLRR